MATRYADVSKNLDAKYQDIELKYETDAINNSISNLLTIYKGEIPGRPDLGSNFLEFIFELNDPITWAAMRAVINNVLQEFEPRITVIDISFEPFVNINVIVVKITYQVIRSGAQGVLSKTFEV